MTNAAAVFTNNDEGHEGGFHNRTRPQNHRTRVYLFTNNNYPNLTNIPFFFFIFHFHFKLHRNPSRPGVDRLATASHLYIFLTPSDITDLANTFRAALLTSKHYIIMFIVGGQMSRVLYFVLFLFFLSSFEIDTQHNTR